MADDDMESNIPDMGRLLISLIEGASEAAETILGYKVAVVMALIRPPDDTVGRDPQEFDTVTSAIGITREAGYEVMRQMVKAYDDYVASGGKTTDDPTIDPRLNFHIPPGTKPS